MSGTAKIRCELINFRFRATGDTWRKQFPSRQTDGATSRVKVCDPQIKTKAADGLNRTLHILIYSEFAHVAYVCRPFLLLLIFFLFWVNAARLLNVHSAEKT